MALAADRVSHDSGVGPTTIALTMRVDDLGPDQAARFRQGVRALLGEYPGWTESELAKVVMHALDIACSHPTFVRALAETDPRTRLQLLEADPAALDAVLSAAFAPMLLEVAREQGRA